MPILTDDKVLSELFPFETVPTHVWIDSTGSLMVVTNGKNTTSNTVQGYFSGDNLDIQEQNDTFKISSPLWQQPQVAPLGRALLNTLLSGEIKTYSRSTSRFRKDSTNKYTNYRGINLTLINLIKDAYKLGNRQFESNRILLNGRPLAFSAVLEEHKYCYEASVLNSEKNTLHKIVMNDLRNYFALDIKVDSIPIQCWNLYLVDSTKLKSKGGEKLLEINPDGESNHRFQNLPFKDFFMSTLGNPSNPYIVINNTNYTGTVDIQLNSPLDNIHKIKKELIKYGLLLIEGIDNFEVLSITQNN